MLTIARLTALWLLIGFGGALLVRIAPGFDVDERELDTRLSATSVEAVRKERSEELNVVVYYCRFVAALARGDLGESRSLRRPVSELLASRIPVTGRLVAGGWIIGWLAALVLAVPVASGCSLATRAMAELLAGFSLSVPAGLIALTLLIAGAGAQWALALILFPRVYRYAVNILRSALASSNVLAARSRGVGFGRILVFHLGPPVAPQLLALAGTTVSVCLGAAIPVEVLTDNPGIGQLAWQAALSRDLPLMISLTLLIAAVTLAANASADWAQSRFVPE